MITSRPVQVLGSVCRRMGAHLSKFLIEQEEKSRYLG